MKYLASAILFIGFCSLSLFTWWMFGFSFEITIWSGLWAIATISYAIFLSTAPFAFKWFEKG